MPAPKKPGHNRVYSTLLKFIFSLKYDKQCVMDVGHLGVGQAREPGYLIHKNNTLSLTGYNPTSYMHVLNTAPANVYTNK